MQISTLFTDSEWDDFVARHPMGCIYHTTSWRNVTKEGLGHKPVYFCSRNQQNKIDGILPMFLVGGLFGKRLVSVPMRDRASVVAETTVAARALIKAATLLTAKKGCRYLELKTNQSLPQSWLEGQNLICDNSWVTTLIDLSKGKETIWKSLDRDAIRWTINRGKKRGLTFENETGKDSMELFYRLFSKTRTEMGIPPFPKKFFLAIWENLLQKGLANLFVIRKNGQPIHAMINVLDKENFIPAYAAPQNEFRKDYPSEFMTWHTMEWAMDHGFKWYDFGADSRLQTGLAFFKRKWGGVPHDMHYYYHLNKTEAIPSFDSSSSRYRLTRNFWKRLPVPVSQVLGGLVTRQLS